MTKLVDDVRRESQRAIRAAELRAVIHEGQIAAASEALVALIAACEPHTATCAGLREAVRIAEGSLIPAYRDALHRWRKAAADVNAAIDDLAELRG